jgi:hypothetical protein
MEVKLSLTMEKGSGNASKPSGNECCGEPLPASDEKVAPPDLHIWN